MKWFLFLIPLFFFSFSSHAADVNQCSSAKTYNNISIPSTHIGLNGFVYYAGIDDCEYYASKITFGYVKGQPSLVALGDWTPTHQLWSDSSVFLNGGGLDIPSLNSSDLIYLSDKPDANNSTGNVSVSFSDFHDSLPNNEPVLNCSVMKDYLTIDNSLFSNGGGVYNGCIYNNLMTSFLYNDKPTPLQTSVFTHHSVDFSKYQMEKHSLNSHFLSYADYNADYNKYLTNALFEANNLYKRFFRAMQINKGDLKTHP
ncbi:TPA: hypothetical protein ACGTQP_004681, partial [Salmonella enterica]